LGAAGGLNFEWVKLQIDETDVRGSSVSVVILEWDATVNSW
jgi:hypothetical protein